MKKARERNTGTHHLSHRRTAILLGLAVFIGIGGGAILSAQAVVDNPDKPLAKNAGRVIALKEVLRIEDEGESYYFKYPYNLRVGPDGSIFIQEQEQLLQFDKDGGFVRNYFKKGQGPGEMVYCGDFIPAEKMLIVLSSSPPKILWFDAKGSVVKEFAYRSKIRGAMKLIRHLDGTYLLSGSDSPFLDLPKTPAIRDWVFHLFSLEEGKEELGDLGAFPVEAFIIPGSGGGGGIIPVNSFIAVPAADGRIVLSHTPEYLIKFYDPALNKVVLQSPSRESMDISPWRDSLIPASGTGAPTPALYRSHGRKSVELQFKRSYERVKPDPAPKRGGVNIDGKSYTSAPVKYTADVTNLFTVGERIWVVTSTVDPAKGVLIDVFDTSGRYLDCFHLKFSDGAKMKTLGLNQTAVWNGHIYAITLKEDDTYAVVKYRIDGPAVGAVIK